MGRVSERENELVCSNWGSIVGSLGLQKFLRLRKEWAVQTTGSESVKRCL